MSDASDLSNEEIIEKLLTEDASLELRVKEITAVEEEEERRKQFISLFKKTFSTVKLDFLREIELEQQARWAEAKVYEADAVAEAGAAEETGAFKRPDRAFVTFPYPYTNGRFHLGHLFTMLKAEYSARFQRLLGKNVLYAQGFHTTGMPIQAAADRLKDEMARFGTPPVFPEEGEEEEEDGEAPAEEVLSGGVKQYKANKTKAASKAGAKKWQWDIMVSVGVPVEEIPKFADPNHWLDYFPPYGVSDLQDLGMAIDWRRSFITTERNPYYDSFVSWQARQLKEKHIKFGKRYTVWAPKEDQACMDHERSSGEGVGPQEYTLIKMRVLELPAELSAVVDEGDKERVFLVAGTLRPETMYGQTNCWVKPSGEYGIYKLLDGSVVVCSEHAALNMAYQEQFFAKTGKPEPLGKIKGTALLGVPLKAALAFKEILYALPMESILMHKATGVVTSVPSDAPADYMNLKDLKEKPGQFTQFNLKPEWLEGTEPVAIIDTPELGTIPAPVACELESVNSRKDLLALDKAKERCYMLSNHHGTMLVGDFKGEKVSEAKDKVRAQLIEGGHAYVYAEPLSKVVSRSGETCVVSLADQWYVDYADEEWKALVEPYVTGEELDAFFPDSKTEVVRGFNWVKQWAISRTYGLGTKLPWDPKYVIESLSDSTIYMAYYTVAHYLHSDLYGQEKGGAQAAAADVDDAVWDYVFLGKALPEGSPCKVPQATLDAMRNEFEYWYPFDARFTGYDLAQNHIAMSLFTHAAIFPKKHWPRGIRLNGHLLLDERKMSKSTGNFLTLQDGLQRYGCDAMRLTLGRAGDGIGSGNFKRVEAAAAVGTLHTLITWAEEAAAPEALAALRTGEYNFFDSLFLNDLRTALPAAKENYAATMFAEALDVGFQTLLNSWRAYVTNVGPLGMQQELHRELLLEYLEALCFLLAPVCPHVAEHLWSKVLRKEGFIVSQLWPDKEAPDASFAQKYAFLENVVLKEARGKLALHEKKKKTKPEEVIVWVGGALPAWHVRLVELVKSNEGADFGALMKMAAQDEVVRTAPKKQKKSFAGIIKKTQAASGSAPAAIDELPLLKLMAPWVAQRLEVPKLQVFGIGEEGAPDTKVKAATGKPGFEIK